MIQVEPQLKEKLENALSKKGLRSTRQREQVYAVVLQSDDHPPADQVYSRVKENCPGISLATVYNCLETLVECELLRQVNFERAPSRYCQAKDHSKHHGHFHCQETGRVVDVDLPSKFIENLSTLLPNGYRIDKVDLVLTGHCNNECHYANSENNPCQRQAG